MESPKYIVIEGSIGVGKTSLVKMLSQEFSARMILEPSDKNPFLENFYQDRGKFAFQTQIFFLINRFEQQQEIAQQDLFQRNIIADYLFAKDRIFAYLNLDEREVKLYEDIYSLLEGNVVTPDLVVFLQASTDVLLKRIKKRAIPYEQRISREYLESLNAAYNDFFFNYDANPLLTVNTSDIDFVNNQDDYQMLIREIGDLKMGKRYLNIRKDGTIW
ncbi:deoxynucleoside kinase [Thermodesulfobacteriota bacterium]